MDIIVYRPVTSFHKSNYGTNFKKPDQIFYLFSSPIYLITYKYFSRTHIIYHQTHLNFDLNRKTLIRK